MVFEALKLCNFPPQIEGLPPPSVEATPSQVLEPDAVFDEEVQDSAEVSVCSHVVTSSAPSDWPMPCQNVRSVQRGHIISSQAWQGICALSLSAACFPLPCDTQ